MNKINRKLEYALMGLKHMRAKQPGELTTIKEITQLYGAPFDATSRVMQILAAKGVLKSEQGAHGGYLITKDLARVSMYELMEWIMGPVEIAHCLKEKQPPCEIRGSCNIVTPVSILNRKLSDFYRTLSVSELIANGK
jgi:Rrf2 family nitric oxide-sensitive transcriptional repressor